MQNEKRVAGITIVSRRGVHRVKKFIPIPNEISAAMNNNNPVAIIKALIEAERSRIREGKSSPRSQSFLIMEDIQEELMRFHSLISKRAIANVSLIKRGYSLVGKMRAFIDSEVHEIACRNSDQGNDNQIKDLADLWVRANDLKKFCCKHDRAFKLRRGKA